MGSAPSASTGSPPPHPPANQHCHADAPPAPDGRSTVRLGAPTPRDVARNLAGWGNLVEVVEPASVQSELARIGAELTARYR